MGQRHGAGLLTYPNGAQKEGIWADGKFEGEADAQEAVQAASLAAYMAEVAGRASLQHGQEAADQVVAEVKDALQAGEYPNFPQDENVQAMLDDLAKSCQEVKAEALETFAAWLEHAPTPSPEMTVDAIYAEFMAERAAEAQDEDDSDSPGM